MCKWCDNKTSTWTWEIVHNDQFIPVQDLFFVFSKCLCVLSQAGEPRLLQELLWSVKINSRRINCFAWKEIEHRTYVCIVFTSKSLKSFIYIYCFQKLCIIYAVWWVEFKLQPVRKQILHEEKEQRARDKSWTQDMLFDEVHNLFRNSTK